MRLLDSISISEPRRGMKTQSINLGGTEVLNLILLVVLQLTIFIQVILKCETIKAPMNSNLC